MEPETPTEENPLQTAWTLKAETEKCHRSFRNAISTQFSIVAFAIGVGLFISNSVPMLLLWQMYGLIIGAVTGLIWILFFDKKRKIRLADYKIALLEVAKRDDINAAGLLLEECHHSDFALRQAVRAALTRLLPNLQTKHAAMLNEKQRKVLNFLPFSTGEVNPNLRLVALRAIGQVGNAESLRVLKKNRASTGEEVQERLASAGEMNHSLKPMRIHIKKSGLDYVSYFRSEVADCIAMLEVRLAQETAAETLLRASQSAENARTLLRPAAHNESDNGTLLRPANADMYRKVTFPAPDTGTESSEMESGPDAVSL